MMKHRIPIFLLVFAVLAFAGCPNPASEIPDPDDPGTTPKICTVTFNAQGGSDPNPATKTVTVGEAYGTLGVSSKAPYSLVGWYTEPAGKGRLVTPATKVSATTDHTLYAFWGTAQWAHSVTGVSEYLESKFSAVASDGSGNVYAVGYQDRDYVYTYGAVSVAGTSGSACSVIVKYDSSGEVQWARVAEGVGSSSYFYGVAVDGSGNIYAVGNQGLNASYTYGGITIQGAVTNNDNAVIVKYDSAGNTLWAKTVTAGSSGSTFNGVAVDSAGNAYAVGSQRGNGVYTYGKDTGGNDVSAAGSFQSSMYWDTNVVIVKYDSSGNPVWARSVDNATSNSEFLAVTVGGSGDIYAAGIRAGVTMSFHGTPNVVLEGGYSGRNALLVKYDTAGNAVWAKTVDTGPDSSEFYSIAADSSGLYAAGCQRGDKMFSYTSGVSVGGVASGSDNAVLVKYDFSGTPLWARSVSSGSNGSFFYSVKVSGSGDIYAAGSQYGDGEYSYGDGASAAGASGDDDNAILVKYDSSGAARWVRTVSAGSGSYFNSVAVAGSGNVFTAGCQYNTDEYIYGTGVSAAGSGSWVNSVLVSYYP